MSDRDPRYPSRMTVLPICFEVRRCISIVGRAILSCSTESVQSRDAETKDLKVDPQLSPKRLRASCTSIDCLVLAAAWNDRLEHPQRRAW